MTGAPKLRCIDAEPIGADVVSKLEQALERAKAGELSSVAVTVVYRDGACGYSWSSAPSISCLVGAVTRMQHALVRLSDD